MADGPPHPAPQAWVVRTALNTRVSLWRRRRREVPLPEPATGATGAAGATDDGGLDNAVDRELMAVLLRLPERPLGAGLSVTALTAGTTTATGQQATLAAWTVQKHPDGSIGVIIRRPQNLAALQVRLAKLGAPVIFVVGQAKPGHGCPRTAFPAAVQLPYRPFPHGVAFELKPGRIPPHAVLWIGLPRNAAKHGPGQGATAVFEVPSSLALVCDPLTPVARAH
jgi:hypothetical protein